MKEFLQTVLIRLKNPKVIASIVSAVIMVLLNTGVITADKSSYLVTLANTILSVLIGIGVLGNPDSHVQVEVPTTKSL